MWDCFSTNIDIATRGKKILEENFIFSRDGPEKRAETRQE